LCQLQTNTTVGIYLLFLHDKISGFIGAIVTAHSAKILRDI